MNSDNVMDAFANEISRMVHLFAKSSDFYTEEQQVIIAGFTEQAFRSGTTIPNPAVLTFSEDKTKFTISKADTDYGIKIYLNFLKEGESQYILGFEISKRPH